jgi:hypothetical protein
MNRRNKLADQDIPNRTAHPGMVVIGQGHVDHLVVGFAFARGGAAIHVEMSEALTPEIHIFSEPLFEFGLNYV